MKYHELVTACNRVCNGVDKSSNPVTKQMCMNYIRLLIRRYLKHVYSKYGDDDYFFEDLNSTRITNRYRKLLWDN